MGVPGNAGSNPESDTSLTNEIEGGIPEPNWYGKGEIRVYSTVHVMIGNHIVMGVLGK